MQIIKIAHLGQLLDHLTPNSLLLTANKRLSNKITNIHHDYQLKLKNAAWKSLDALPLVNWLERCYESVQLGNPAKHDLLLNDFQEYIIWQKIIQNESAYALLNISETARLAQKAWQLLNQYQINLNTPQLNENPDNEQFILWAKQFKEYCHKQNFLDIANLTNTITQRFEQHYLTVPHEIHLIGFIELTPDVNHLFDVLSAQDCSIHLYQLKGTSTTTQTVSLTSIDDEIITLARWAKHLALHEPHASIGCIVPKLNDHRAKIERVFTDVCQSDITFNLSSGTALFDEPMIYTGLTILSMIHRDIPLENISHLLRSPFLAKAEEHITNRAQLETAIRKLKNPTYTLTQLIHLSILNETDLAQYLKTFQQLLNNSHQTYFPSACMKLFSQLLSTLGWPGERTLNSREYQTLEHWKKLLNECVTLDVVLHDTWTPAEALTQLKQRTTRTLFQPQTIEAPIQILGMLESTDLSFTHLWVMELDDLHWPPPAKPNPLLPISLQRQYNMPHASAERELAFCELMISRFQQQANTVIFSHSTQLDDKPLQPSLLLHDFNDITIQQLNLTALPLSPTPVRLESVTDEQAPIINDQEKIAGGTSIFKLQAACPFRAFAQIRLHADAIDEPSINFNAKERGSLLHTALELLWRHIQSHQHLMQLTPAELKSLIKKNIHRAVQKQLKNRHIPTHLIELEQKRAYTLLIQWFELEKARHAFTVVSQENWDHTQIGPLKIRLRMDRIDCTADQQYIVIDYKSGKTNINTWFGDRPDEPQLPLYAVYSHYPIDAISFAQLCADEITFKTASKQQNILPNDKQIEWDKQCIEWKQTLEKLAQDFYTGNAQVDPKNKHQTCRYCQLKTLCRVKT